MNELVKVLRHIRSNPLAFQSNYAREHAAAIAESACRGYITCLQDGSNKGRWFITSGGLNILEGGAQ